MFVSEERSPDIRTSKQESSLNITEKQTLTDKAGKNIKRLR